MIVPSLLLIVLALVIAAGGVTVARAYRSGFAIAVLMVGIALCLCIEAGRQWS
jgi:hypothetical protein